ncbi:hypothetical protein C5167_042390 [Papaver somniferum]|uniref:Ribosomal protein L34Ae n=1 Tax=Papaver somniferum TaxID=3469 RepID=A0A4Y7L2N6_PAPSO|nr:uncharacterized protein LOC113318078 [Papaver somniferum]XP_026421991.1 uncharacterized protein LOC113318078 [Papaver somniferum]RZC79813.1 hypothetical protein C5167_042390 [Papaver somniferum]
MSGTHFCSPMNNKGFVMFLSSIWVFVTTYTFFLGKFIIRYFFRFNVGDGVRKQKSDYFPVLQHKINNQIDESESDSSEPKIEPEVCSLRQEISNQIDEQKLEPEVLSLQQGINNQIDDDLDGSEQKLESEVLNFLDTEYVADDDLDVSEQKLESEVLNFLGTECVEDDEVNEKETPKFSFKFQFPIYEETRGETNEETEEEEEEPEVSPNSSLIPMNTNTSKYEFLPGQNISRFIQEPKVMNFTVNQLYNDGLIEENNDDDFHGGSLDKTFIKPYLKIENSVDEILDDDSCSRQNYEKTESVKPTEVQLSEKEQLVGLESTNFDGAESLTEEEEIIGSDFDRDSDSDSAEFGETMLEAMEDIQNSSDAIHAETSETMDPGLNECPEVNDLQNSSILGTEFLTVSEFDVKEQEPNLEECNGKMKNLLNDSGNSKEQSLQKSIWPDTEEADEFESLWEHQELIEQLKMEIKKVRATGLPTIFEESEESPKVVEDLKPWKIDEKLLHEDRIGELHNFYKIYTERMRKFDILNYQKMYAIGFLQLKDPLQTMSLQKSTTPTLTSVLSQSFGLSKRIKPEGESMEKFIKELKGELEVVYVGQLCLSWEYLHWQYLKARELLESDQYEVRRYNEVAGEFQQFQVLIQRFLEDEPFQGPRVQNYIKNRCVLRNLLQVPVVKEDSKDKDGTRRKDAITCSMLLQIIEESMKILWKFLRADRNEGNMILKGLLGPQIKLHDPGDAELLVDVQTTLQKKDKKLKEIMRIGNCIVRKFQKQNEEHSSQAVFHSQVDLKLVARVLHMSKITNDQLVWCRRKLNNITLVDRKIHLESSFLPFPC